MQNGGVQELMHVLATFDLSNVNLRRIPQTAALREQKLQSLSAIERWWYECLLNGELPKGSGTWPKSIERVTLQHDYQAFCEGVSEKARSSETEVGRFLNRMVPGLSNRRSDKVRYYGLPSLRTCQSAFEKLMRSKIDWPQTEIAGTETPILKIVER